MNPLLLFPPETAHQLAMLALRSGLMPGAANDPPALRRVLLGRELRNPIGLAAGAEKRAEALVGWSRMGFGVIEAGTVTLAARAGNPRPRIWRRPRRSIVNWMGLPGEGLEPVVERLRRFADRPEREPLLLGVSIAAPSGEESEFQQLATALAPWCDYLALNVSCPNLAHAESGIEPIAAQIRAVCSVAGGRPLLLKIGPTRDRESLAALVAGAKAAGAAGFIATNTVSSLQRELLGDLDMAWPQREGSAVGGYSGPALLPISEWMVSQIRALAGPETPIIGVGGVQSGADALRLLEAGADAIQLYTGLIYRGQGLLNEIKRTLLAAQSD